MFRLVGVVVSIGLADSLNPTTIGPALYLSTGKRPRTCVLQFTLGVFVVYLLGGAIIALGPGQLLLSLVPKPDMQTRHILEVVIGAAMIAGAALLWRHRDKLSDREAPRLPTEGRSSAILGATISAVELPTAFPYFAAIAAIVGSGLGPPRQLALLVLFNLCFVLPLVGILVTLTLAGERAKPLLTKTREFLQRRWPVLLAPVALAVGIFVILLGITGFASSGSGRFHRFIRHFRRILHP
jgi:cytochrome c biogenesis protein CcdA